MDQTSEITESGIDLKTLPIEEPEGGLFTAYANVFFVNWTLYDVRIRFSELMQVSNDETPSMKNQHGILLERVAVTMPWHQVKRLSDLLSAIVANYEAVNGKLKPVQLAATPNGPPKQK